MNQFAAKKYRIHDKLQVIMQEIQPAKSKQPIPSKT
jgi:hypothetical protein